MKLHHLLQKDLIFWDYDLKSKEELYNLISERMSKMFNLDKNAIYQAFKERESLGYTIFPGGSIIPHGRIDNLDDLIISIVKTKKSLEISNEKADLFYCILTSNTGSNKYLKTLASFAKISYKYNLEIRNKKNADEVLEFISALDLDIIDRVKIKDILSEKVITAKLGETIESVIDKMKKYNLIFFPVIDGEERYIGQINILDVLKIAYPQYITMLTDIGFLSNFRAFEDFHDKELSTKVKDIYTKNTDKSININANIIEFGYLLVKNHWHHLTVIDDENKVVGVISTRNILQNILRA